VYESSPVVAVSDTWVVAGEFSVDPSFEGELSCEDSSRQRMADSVLSCRSISERSVSHEPASLHRHALHKDD